MDFLHLKREGGREEGRGGGKEGGREVECSQGFLLNYVSDWIVVRKQRKGKSGGLKEGRSKGWKEGGKEGSREGGREGGREVPGIEAEQ